MGLSQVMLAALDEAEYLDPTPIQAGLIPRALAGKDLMGQAQTGTGKTAAFAIPILERLQPRTPGAGPQALVLVPTRELAVQVRDECDKLAAGRERGLRPSTAASRSASRSRSCAAEWTWSSARRAGCWT